MLQNSNVVHYEPIEKETEGMDVLQRILSELNDEKETGKITLYDDYKAIEQAVQMINNDTNVCYTLSIYGNTSPTVVRYNRTIRTQRK